MEMRQNLAELLSSVVSTTYGSFYGAVTTALADRSRSTLADVNRAVPHLSTSDVRLAIVTLVQQHLVNHHTDEHGVAFYEPNWEHAYNFTCRLPTLRKFVEERYDSTVAEIFHDIAQAGVISVGDIITELCGTSAITTDPNHSNADQPNHAVETSARTNGEKQALHELTVQENDIYSALNLLLSAGYLMRVNSRQFWPAYDRDGEANNEIMVVQFPAGAGVKKERDALRMESDKLLRRWRKEDERCVPPGTQTGFQNGRKRDRSPNNNDEDEPAFKRQQTHGNPPVSVEQYRSWLTEHQESLKACS
jgi:Fe2+ or Zn2+ uptake regulation protein